MSVINLYTNCFLDQDTFLTLCENLKQDIITFSDDTIDIIFSLELESCIIMKIKEICSSGLFGLFKLCSNKNVVLFFRINSNLEGLKKIKYENVQQLDKNNILTSTIISNIFNTNQEIQLEIEKFYLKYKQDFIESFDMYIRKEYNQELCNIIINKLKTDEIVVFGFIYLCDKNKFLKYYYDEYLKTTKKEQNEEKKEEKSN